MNFAKNIYTGNVESAGTASKLSSFSCPVCDAKVTLRKGFLRSPHFAHKKGLGKPSCENFHPSLSSVSISGVIGVTHSTVPTSSLYSPSPPRYVLQLTKEKKEISWKIGLAFSPSHSSKGFFELNAGMGRRLRIHLINLKKAEKIIEVDISAPQHNIPWISPEVNERYKEVIEGFHGHFHKSRIIVFTNNSGQKKYIASELTLGEYVYFVWHRSKNVNVPQEFELITKLVNGSWQCSLLHVPINMSPGSLEWLQNEIEIPLSGLNLTANLISPISPRMSVYGAIPFDYTFPLLGKVKRLGVAQNDDFIEVKHNSSVDKERLEPVETNYFEIAPQQPSELSLSINNHEIALFTPQKQPRTPNLSGCHLVTLDDEGQREVCSFWSSVVAEHFDQIRNGIRYFNSLCLEQHVVGQLIWTTSSSFGDSPSRERIEATSERSSLVPSTYKIKQEIRVLIEKLLSDKNCEIFLDLNANGCIHIPRLVDKETSSLLQLDPKIRKQIEWSLLVNPSFSTKENLVLGRNLSQLNGEELVCLFANTKFINPLIAHKRFILKKLYRSGFQKVIKEKDYA